ncbi:MAG: hypothetical protein LBL45_11055, partial [Treponema sp.]|nr:hypothetical protein [Treponema sp.]
YQFEILVLRKIIHQGYETAADSGFVNAAAVVYNILKFITILIDTKVHYLPYSKAYHKETLLLSVSAYAVIALSSIRI